MEELKEIKDLLENNLEYSKEIHGLARKIRRYILFSQITTVIKIVIFIGLVFLAYISIPFLEDLLIKYNEIRLQLP